MEKQFTIPANFERESPVFVMLVVSKQTGKTIETPLLTVIILNWNGLKFLARCLDSMWVQTFKKFEVVLVDNGSVDGSVDTVRAGYSSYIDRADLPRLRLVELVRNEGFSGGNQAGLMAADPASKYIATLNNDAWATPGWLAALLEAIESRPDIAATGGPMLFASAPDKVASAGIEVRRDGLALDRAVGQPLTSESQPLEIFGVCAGAALYRRDALDEVGFFDPAFFAYLEDADLAWRLRLAGWRSLYVPEAAVSHEYSGTGGQGSPFKNFQLGRNRWWVIFKNWPLALLLRHAPMIIFYDLAASVYTLSQGQPHSVRGRLAALDPRHMGRLWRQRRKIQAQRVISLAELERWLERPSGPKATLQARQTVEKLAHPVISPKL